jgi:AraC family transcriptional regulator, transcriptional activator of pobA
MTEIDPIHTVEFHSSGLASFHIRRLQSFTYPAVAEISSEVPHRHDFQEIFWVRTGSGKQSIDEQILDIQAQTFYLIARGQVHQFIKGNNIDGYVLRYTDEFLPQQPQPGIRYFQNAIFNNINCMHTLQVKQDAVAEFDQLMEQMKREFEQPEKFGKQIILVHLLQILLIKLERLLKTIGAENDEVVDDNHDIFRDFITALEQHYNQQHGVSYYAGLLNIPARQLAGTTRRLVGKTAKQVVEERLMLEAKRYLRYSDQSVKEIAYSLGYEDPSYFSKVFKKLTGVTPNEYKN